MCKRLFEKLSAFGPGLLWAGAAIGVSHLVQSTTAGATYGFTLIPVILLALVIKYPFFEFGLRYTIAAKENLLEGYLRLGRWTLILFLILTLGTMFTVQAAVTIVTAGLAANLFGINLSPELWSLIIIVICGLILTVGKYHVLDNFMKVIIIVLSISTLIAVSLSVTSSSHSFHSLAKEFTWHEKELFFIVALVGWMPCPIDGSVWHSLWIQAKAKDLGHYPNLKTGRLDFNIGYIGTTILALCFLILGAFLLYGNQITLSTNTLKYSEQLIAIYTETLGDWSFYIIAIAAFSAMFSTTLSCLDAAPRVLRNCTELLSNKQFSEHLYWFWLIIISAGAMSIIFIFTANMRILVTIATTLSFLTSPIIGFMNYYLATHERMPKELRPGVALRAYSWFGLIFLTISSIWYLWLWFN